MAFFRYRYRNGLNLVVSETKRRKRRHRVRLRIGGFKFYLVVALAAAGFMFFKTNEGKTVATSKTMPICYGSAWSNCVVDGDTIRLNGEKIRLESFNTPEIKGACSRERQLARQAARRLSQILSSQPFTVIRSGRDRYGRTLANVSNSSGNVGQMLIREGLAHEWRGRRESWCV